MIEIRSVHKNVFPKITVIISEQRETESVMSYGRQFSTRHLT